ncbi:MAG TPA: NPCBM/NEW2 domain-containing protein [Tepidisphaeraceae bacterium]|jgi:hypothetical protein|nr:NPCBM/NEW2 domain-containing protein [Tepidisphaeraceae bacterium]
MRMCSGFVRCTFRIAAAVCLVLAGSALAGNIFDDEWSPPPTVKADPPPVTAPSQLPGNEPSVTAPSRAIDGNSPPEGAEHPGASTSAGVSPPGPIPASNEQAKARKMFKDVYSRQLADQSGSGRQAIARQLLADAAKITDAPIDRFVLLTGARRAALDAGDVEMAISSDEELCKSFAVDARSSRLDLLGRLAKTAKSPSGCAAIVREAFQKSDDAELQGQYNVAEQFAAIALAASKGSDKVASRTEASARESEIRAVATAYAQLDKFLAILKVRPADPDASLAVGRFYCLMVGQWPKGLKFLAAGSDAKLSAAAKADILGADSLAIAEQWRALAEKEKPLERRHIRRRAAGWYADALKTQTGLGKLKAEKELAALNEGIPAPPVYLSEIKELSVEGIVQEREWTLAKNVLNSNNIPLAMSGVSYTHGLGFNPGDGHTVRIAYSIEHRYRRFTGVVGVNDTGGGFEAILTFKILGNGKELWKSRPCREAGKAQSYDVDVTGVDRLEIVVECPGTARGACVAWADPKLDSNK